MAAQAVRIETYDHNLIVSVAGTEDKWDAYFNSYAQGSGFTEAKNPAGVRAFHAYQETESLRGEPMIADTRTTT